MENLRDELYLGSLVGVLGRELHGELEGTALPLGLLGATNNSAPVEDIVAVGGSDDPSRGVVVKSLKVLDESFLCHFLLLLVLFVCLCV